MSTFACRSMTNAVAVAVAVTFSSKTSEFANASSASDSLPARHRSSFRIRSAG